MKMIKKNNEDDNKKSKEDNNEKNKEDNNKKNNEDDNKKSKEDNKEKIMKMIRNYLNYLILIQKLILNLILFFILNQI